MTPRSLLDGTVITLKYFQHPALFPLATLHLEGDNETPAPALTLLHPLFPF